MAEVVARLPAEFPSRALVHIDSVDGWKKIPASAVVLGFVVRNALSNYLRRVDPQLCQIARQKGRGCTDDVLAKSDRRRALDGQQMRAHDVFDSDAPVKKFIRLGVRIRVGCAHFGIVVLFGEEARGSQRDARQSLVSMKQV